MRTETPSPGKKPVNLTIQKTLLDEARAMNLNLSQAAEAGVRAAVRKAKEEAWLEENKEAIEAHNKRVEEIGTYITPLWMREE